MFHLRHSEMYAQLSIWRQTKRAENNPVKLKTADQRRWQQGTKYHTVVLTVSFLFHALMNNN